MVNVVDVVQVTAVYVFITLYTRMRACECCVIFVFFICRNPLYYRPKHAACVRWCMCGHDISALWERRHT